MLEGSLVVNCTNCGHPKSEHNGPEVGYFGTCLVCQTINNGNITHCQDGFTTIPGGNRGDSICTGYGHKKWCKNDGREMSQTHFLIEFENTRAMLAFMGARKKET